MEDQVREVKWIVGIQTASYNTSMSYRGVVKGGVIVLEPNVHLAEGQTVEVTEITEAADVSNELPGAGLWRDRTDLKDSADESLRIRRSMEHRDA
jgi:hypothetical protein